MHHIRLGACLMAVCVALACVKPTSDDPAKNDTETPIQRQVGVDTATDPLIRRLEREAVALAKVDGCTSASQCRSAPVGSRACGGPRYYLPYCPLTTDSSALFRKLAEVERAEQDYNRRNQLVSTCEMRLPGELVLTGGACAFRAP